MRAPNAVDSEIARRWSWYFACVNGLHAEKTHALMRRLDAARQFLDLHLDEPIDLETIARRAHLSKFHFLRLFKDKFQETPLRYLQRRRLEAAKRMLIQTDLPVTSICFRVGYESLGSFSSLFRRFAGDSPYGYRRRYVVVPRTILSPERSIPSCWLQRYQLAPAT
jgi:AraC-like DNA-binding protein